MPSASLLKRSGVFVLLGGALAAQDFIRPAPDQSMAALRAEVQSLEMRVRTLESQLHIKNDPYKPEIIPVQGRAKPDK